MRRIRWARRWQRPKSRKTRDDVPMLCAGGLCRLLSMQQSLDGWHSWIGYALVLLTAVR
jgi:hypothetical protein